MAVFVDDMRAAYRGMKMCHMMADTTAELLAMAGKIGVATHHIQHVGTAKEHFDICQSKRALAISYGAKSITLRQSVVLVILKNARNAVLHGGTIAVPKQLLICPECQGQLDFEVNEWDTETGLPVFGGYYLNCENESSVNHRHWQSDWQPAIYRAGELFRAVEA